ncbi:MAG: hypothetical protein ACKVOB_09360 [Sphingomonas sp.]
MDLNFPRFDSESSVGSMPVSLAVLMVGIATRQSAGPTAVIHALAQDRSRAPARLQSLLAPAHGAFNRAVAALLDAEADE